jgi:hypothetical protein
VALAPDQPDLLFQPAGPFRAGPRVGQLEGVPQFLPGGSAGLLFQMTLDAGSEFGVGHGDGWRTVEGVESYPCNFAVGKGGAAGILPGCGVEWALRFGLTRGAVAEAP